MPKRWSELNTMTIAFGQGLNVAPLQALMAVSALVNGGHMMAPTFLPRSQAGSRQDRPQGGERADVRIDALPDALQRDPRLGRFRQHSRLLRRRQDRHGGQDHPRPLFAGPGVHDLHGDHARRQAQIPLPGDLRRAAGCALATTASTPPPGTPAAPPARSSAGSSRSKGCSRRRTRRQIHSPSSPAWAMEPTPTRSARSERERG